MCRKLAEAKIFCPLKLLKKEPFFILWPIYSLACAIITWFSYLKSEEGNFFFDGIMFAFSIGIITPFIFSFLSDVLVTKKTKNTIKFASLKVVYTVISLVLTMISIVSYYNQSMKTNIILQLFIFGLSIFVSFLFYLCFNMGEFREYVELYDDVSYLDDENNRMKNIEENSKKIDKDDVGGSKI